ncbi:MAG: tryptophan--tRNA ligase [Candidatus Thermoplasmatota archaeon]
MKIDPWSSTKYQDYKRLRDEFGIEEFNIEKYKDLPKPHRLLRRGVIFGHRNFNRIKKSIQQDKPWVILTGLMPSGKMHLGHKMVIDQIIYYQSIGAEIVIAVADIESYATRGYTLKEAEEIALKQYIPNYIALGLKPEKCRIYFQSKNTDVKDLGYILGKKINWSQMQATYGFNESSNMTHVFSPLIQTGDILHVQLRKNGGIRPVLVPVGVDQDPHIRLSRDVASAYRLYNVKTTRDQRIGVFVKVEKDIGKLLEEAEKILKNMGYNKLEKIKDYKALYINDADQLDVDKIDEKLAIHESKMGGYGFMSPSATFHRFMTGLTGEKMSSSKPETAIFLTDKPNEAKKKIMNAKTGGAVSLEEHKENGGKPEECMIYELFVYHLIEDDQKLKEIYNNCRKGKQLCGQCKKIAVEKTTDLLEKISEKKKDIDQSSIKKYVEKQ